MPYPPGIDAPKVRYYAHGGLTATAISPPWSTLTAYDLDKGTIKWQVPYGDAPQGGPSDKQRGNLFQRSGIAVTAGGLIFFASNEGKLRILDKNTGKQLRVIDLPFGSQSVPCVYQVNGREYIVINDTGAFALGWSSAGPPTNNGLPKWQGDGPPAYIAFALPVSASTDKSSGLGIH
jgi:quinoprotein glucose dehydrogenase